MEHTVKRGLERCEAVKNIGVDEMSFQKRYEYVTVVASRDDRKVLYVRNGRSEKSLDKFYTGLDGEQLDGIETVSMDIWDPYIASTRRHISGDKRKIAFDKFNIAKHLGEAVDKVRRGETRILRAAEGMI